MLHNGNGVAWLAVLDWNNIVWHARLVLVCTLIYYGDTVTWSVGCYWYSTMVSPERWYLFGTIWCGCYYVVVTMAMVWLHFWWHDMTTCLVLSSTMVWPDRCDRRRSSAATSCPTADWTRTVSIVSPVIRFVLIISICIHLSYFQPSRQTTRWCR